MNMKTPRKNCSIQKKNDELKDIVRECPSNLGELRDVKKNRPRQKQVFIFDWDDTIFPTSYLQSRDLKYCPHEEIVLIRNLLFGNIDKRAEAIINEVVLLGDLVIVTNAQKYWIDICRKYMPRVHNSIEKNKIDIYSEDYARIKHSQRYKELGNSAKKVNFELVLQDHCKSSKTKYSVISIGDGESEVLAAEHIFQNFKPIDVTCIKLRKDPSSSFLKYELKKIQSQLKSLKFDVTGFRSFDLNA